MARRRPVQGSRRLSAGFTVLEIMLTVAILSLIASMALPSFSSLDSDRVDSAAARVAGALRYARDASTTTRRHIGLEAFPSTASLQLFEFDVSVNPPVKNFTVRNPLTKALYDLNLDDLGVTLGDVDFNGDLDVVFTPDGTPMIPGHFVFLEEQSFVELKLGSIGRKVTLDAVTGRVGVQPL